MKNWDKTVKALRRNMLPKALGVKRITQPEFAKMIENIYVSEFNIKLGCSVPTVQKWEAGEVVPGGAAQLAILKLAENVKTGKVARIEKI